MPQSKELARASRPSRNNDGLVGAFDGIAVYDQVRRVSNAIGFVLRSPECFKLGAHENYQPLHAILGSPVSAWCARAFFL